jgi:fructoselysine-6-P-deglycase FrlB-like protein
LSDTQAIQLQPIPTDRAAVDLAYAQRPQIEAFVTDLVRRGLRNVYLVGAGGSLIAMQNLQYVMDRRSRKLPTRSFPATEFIYRAPAAFGPGSLVVTASHSGTTKETVAAATFAREHGATVVATTKLSTSPLAQAADVAFTYDVAAEDHGLGDPKDITLALLGLVLLRETGEMSAEEYGHRVATLGRMQDVLLEAVRETEDLNHRIAEALKDEPIIYVLGSGPNEATAYTLAMCFLQEMQWKHAAHFHGMEFLHGAMEVVTEDTPVIVFLSEEATRPIDERAKAFVQRYSKKGWFIDSRDLRLTGIAPEDRPWISPFALDAVMARLARHFEAATGHDLKERRYMFKVDY